MKKRTKKLLTVARSSVSDQVDSVLVETNKSFLVLFFKKELLSCLSHNGVPSPKGNKMIEGTHFQNAYVTRDMSKWMDVFRARADVRKMLTNEGTVELWTPAGLVNQTTKLAFIWVGDLQFELIQPFSGADIYAEALPQDDGLRFHHICNRVADWDSFRVRVDRQPYPIVLERGGMH